MKIYFRCKKTTPSPSGHPLLYQADLFVNLNRFVTNEKKTGQTPESYAGLLNFLDR